VKIGMNTLLWTGTFTEQHLDLFDRIAAIGFDGVEFSLYDPNASPWPAMKRRLDDLGLKRTGVTMVSGDDSLADESPAVRRHAVDHLKACLDVGAFMGVEVMAGPLVVPVGKLVGRGRTEGEWARAVEGLREVALHAREVGIPLAMEPLNRFESYFLNTAADAAALVAEVDVEGFGYLFDTFHFNIEERDLVGALRATLPAVKHFHASENDRSTPGVGHVPWKALFAELHAADYQGWVTIEAFGQALPELAAATCIWRRMYDTEEQLAADGLKFLRGLSTAS
jgi:D-psicose/D-tagatose/L-ribulose 3-epimerase